MSDNKPNEEEKVEEKAEEKVIPNLDQVHELAVESLENEQENDDEEVKDEPEKVEEVVEDKPAEKVEAPEPTPTPEEKAADIPAVQEDIPKIKIKDSEGVEHEFGTTEEIPDDFEPITYKAFAVATSKLAQREMAVEKARVDAETQAANEVRLASIDKIKKGWDDDLQALIKAGDIAEGDEGQPTVDGVYRVMQEELNAGRPANSFSQAYEIFQFRESKKAAQDRVAKKNDDKKKAGSRVMGGGGANPAASQKQGKVFEAPPSGVSLDQVHENVLNNL